MDRVDHLGVVDSLQVGRGDAEVRVAELALDHVERHALARQLDRVGVTQLVGREAPADAGLVGEPTQLAAHARLEQVVVESESTERAPRAGIIEEVVREEPGPRYRMRWDDGHESIYTPGAGALRKVAPAKGS